MRRWISRSAFVVALGFTATTLIAAPAHAAWFRYPGISCGPDQHAVIGTVSKGPGKISGDYAYVKSNGGIGFGSFSYATGSHSTPVPSRRLDSYDVVASGGATLLARSVSCQ